MDNKQAQYLHQVLDKAIESKVLSPQDVEALREHLPELPKQKTLTEITHDVYRAWYETLSNHWKESKLGDLETWLNDLHEQLQGLKDTSAVFPALPAGMRIADHEHFGRVVVSPGVGVDKCHEIFYLEPGMKFATGISEVEPDSLTFLSPKPAHPEFLETEADYRDAPEGTIVASSGRFPCIKGAANEWACSGITNNNFGMSKIGRRNVIRWGWGK